MNRQQKVELPIGQRFDFIIGTSVGAIIAIALAIGKTATYCERELVGAMEGVFGSANRATRAASVLKSKYDSKPLEEALSKIYGERTIADANVDFCATAVSLQNAQPRLYKTDYMTRNVGRLDEKLIDVGLASSAAPTFFRAHSSRHSTDLIDGGLVANNPAMIGLVDALQFQRPSKRGTAPPTLGGHDPRLIMVSLGTGQQCGMPYNARKLRAGGWLHWAKPALEVMFQAQSAAVHHQVSFLLRERYIRVDPLLKFPMALDDLSHLDDLKNLADVTEPVAAFLNANFFD